jgi:hypothetical protein
MHLIYNNVKKLWHLDWEHKTQNIAIENCKLNLETYIEQRFIMKFGA